jgi:hypothetical protein
MDLDGMVLIGKRRNHQQNVRNDVKIIHYHLELLDGVTKHLSSIFSESGVRNEKKIVHYHLKTARYEERSSAFSLHQNLQQLRNDVRFSQAKISVSFPTPSRPYPNYQYNKSQIILCSLHPA